MGPFIQQNIKNSQNPLVTRINTNTLTIHGLQTQVNELWDQLDSQSTGYEIPPLLTGNSSDISTCPPSCPCSQLTHKYNQLHNNVTALQSHFFDTEITTNLVDQQLTPFQEGLQDLNNKFSTHLEAFNSL